MLLSLTGKRWAIPETAFSPSHVLARIAAARSIDPDARGELTAPSAYPDMERAVERVQRAITGNECIALFGDYDCDGVTSIAILLRSLRRRGVEPHVRLPHRVRDGYGLHSGIVEELRNAGVKLLITADTGVTGVHEIAALKEHGIDTIVTDHHSPHEELPMAYAFIHPALAPAVPEPHPCGAGVALQLVRALEEERWEDDATDWALAMLGTIADLVELRGNNRALVQRGLAALNELRSSDTPLGTLAASVSRSSLALLSADVAFTIAPRINAAGRMDDPLVALHALLEGGDALTALKDLNQERQEAVQYWMDWALAECAATPTPPLLFLAHEELPHGLLGLIAGRLADTYGCPALVAHKDEEICRASLRSIPSYHITEGLTRAADLLQTYGGHSQAAGCTFTAANADALRDHLSKDIASRVSCDDRIPLLPIDATLALSDITLGFIEKLSELEPYGQGNPEPRFLLLGCSISNARTVGNDKTHLQARIGSMKVIGFGLGHLLGDTDTKLDAVVRLGIDTWNGRREPQLFLDDLRVHDKTAATNTRPKKKSAAAH